MSEVIKQWDETHETSTKKMTELQKTLLMDVEDETSTKKFHDDTYTPLYQGLTIDKSKVHGLGLFTEMDFPAGTDFGETHVFVVNRSRRDWVRTPLGGFINHSETPNCYINTESEDRTLYSIRPIKRGEEITVYYRFESYDGMTA